jgi:acetolactate synthase-1/2/3 large subunit
MDAPLRRPWIDWMHTAMLEGDLVRGFTKWDDQPASINAIPEALLRGYRIAVTEPQGPVYICFDKALQEQPIAQPFHLPDVSRYRPAVAPEPDRAAIGEAADLLLQAELPLAFGDAVGREPHAVRVLVDLAELLAMPVLDIGRWWRNFPSPHPLDFTGMHAEITPEADVVLGLDMLDFDSALRVGASRAGESSISLRTSSYPEPSSLTIRRCRP